MNSPTTLSMSDNTQAVELREALENIVPEVPRIGERETYGDDFVLSIRVRAGDLRKARAALQSAPIEPRPAEGGKQP